MAKASRIATASGLQDVMPVPNQQRHLTGTDQGPIRKSRLSLHKPPVRQRRLHCLLHPRRAGPQSSPHQPPEDEAMSPFRHHLLNHTTMMFNLLGRLNCHKGSSELAGHSLAECYFIVQVPSLPFCNKRHRVTKEESPTLFMFFPSSKCSTLSLFNATRTQTL